MACATHPTRPNYYQIQETDTMHKFSALFATLFFLSACAGIGGQAFRGESVTYGSDNILRNDVMAVIRTAERNAFNCRRIESVDSKITQARKVGGRMQVSEVWTVQACGESRNYRIFLREDERGETDFNVELPSR